MNWKRITDKKMIIILINIIIIICGGSLLLSFPNNQNLLNIGAGLLASGIVAIFYLIYPQIDLERDYLRFRKMGLLEVYPRRDQSKEYENLLKKAEKFIDVLGLGLNQFREDNEAIIKEKALQGVEIRLLVIDPKSPVTAVRSYQENDLAGEMIKIPIQKLKRYVNEVNESIENEKKGKKIQIKYYNAVSSTMIFRIDNVMFVGPYFHKIPSRTTITFKIENDTEIFNQYSRHFNDLWNDKECKLDFE